MELLPRHSDQQASGETISEHAAFICREIEMIHQLRIYEIFEENKAVFHARFRDHAARIMQRHGLQIIAMWEAKTEKRTEFVYLLRWPDEQTQTVAWAAFMADPFSVIFPSVFGIWGARSRSTAPRSPRSA